jgi:leucyl-tRNA synthetase
MRARPLSPSRSALLAQRAHQMRLTPTLSESNLWQALRGKQLGVSFRRQAVIGQRIVDFLAPSAALVVEVDGGYHDQRWKADARRTAELERLGYRVLRVPANMVRRELSAVLVLVRAAL